MTKKIIDQFLDEEGNPILLDGDIVVDRESGKTIAETVAAGIKSDDDINALIQTALTPIQTTLNNFLTGDPDDNGTLDRLRELVQAITDNKDNIDNLLELSSSGTGIAFVDSASATPEYNGKIRMVVSEFGATTEA